MSAEPTVWAVVPAAGQGARMGGKKQGLLLAGRPLLRWTVDVFEGTAVIAGVVVAVPAEDVAGWQRALADCRKVRAVVPGGPSRQDSVGLALAAVPGDVGWVVVHDGVRPCVSAELVTRVVSEARVHGAAIAALPIVETIKRGAGEWVKETLDREGLWAVQTPQAFQTGLLREAHRQAAGEGILATDDAALVERLGVTVRLVPGLPGNVKVTRPEDLLLAEALIHRRAEP